MKHIVKVNNIQDAKDSDIRPIIALDNSGILFFEGAKAVPEGFVDFGLASGTLWSTKNIGATNGDTAESWYGNYYAWGELETKEVYDQSNYKYSTNGGFLTKYCNNTEYGNEGFTDELTQLVPEDDVATVTKSAWRMPTKEDFEELIAGTTNSWETDYKGISGLNGRLFIKAKITRQAFKNIPLYSPLAEGEITDEIWADYFSIHTLEETNKLNKGNDIREQIFKDEQMTIKADYNTDYGFVEKDVDPSVSMFIPAAGYRDGFDIYDVGSSCSFWSSSLDLDGPSGACDLSFNSDDIRMNYDYRYYGFSVRPIC